MKSQLIGGLREEDAGPRAVLRRGLLTVALAILLALGGAASASAEEYEAPDAGNPLRIVGYVIHPVGLVFDYLVLRPCYWVGSHEPFKTFFGRSN